jgi:hypothetical protein
MYVAQNCELYTAPMNSYPGHYKAAMI